MIDAVLFDWGDTLMPFEEVATDEYVLERITAGLAVLEREDAPDPNAVLRWQQAQSVGHDRIDELDYVGLLTACFEELHCGLGVDDVRGYARAALWEAEMILHPQTLALLDSLRDRGLKLGLVSNTPVPLWLLEPVLERQGLAERLDSVVLSSEVGKRKPHPLIFERALAEVGVPAGRTLFVGDRLRQDVRGASEAGMRTVQALWSRADEHPDGIEPDYEAYTMMDVLNIVRRLNGGG